MYMFCAISAFEFMIQVGLEFVLQRRGGGRKYQVLR